MEDLYVIYNKKQDSTLMLKNIGGPFFMTKEGAQEVIELYDNLWIKLGADKKDLEVKSVSNPDYIRKAVTIFKFMAIRGMTPLIWELDKDIIKSKLDNDLNFSEETDDTK